MSETHDVLGQPLAQHERALMDAFRRVVELARRSDLPPCASANAKEAAACLWQAVNDLALTGERPSS
jgi:hypothetical protein